MMECTTNGKPVSVVVIPDNYQAYEISHFCVTPKYQKYVERLVIPNGLIKDRVEKVASEIVEYYASRDAQSITTLCVLKGAFKFCAGLIDAMERNILARGIAMPISTHFVRIRSYVNDSSGDSITLTGVDEPSVYKDKDILIVEDIIDTGRTMEELQKYLNTLQAKSVTDVRSPTSGLLTLAYINGFSLLVKRTPRSSGYRPRFAGFEIPDDFVIGYGFDYNDYFRDLNHICVINKAGMEYFAAPKKTDCAKEESKPSV